MVFLTNFKLDVALAVSAAAFMYYGDDPTLRVQQAIAGLKQFPDHYTPLNDFIANPMNGTLAILLFILAVFSWVKTYYVERTYQAKARRRSIARTSNATKPSSNQPLTVTLHGVGSFVEMAVGLAYILRPEASWLAYAAAVLALTINVPTSLMLIPSVGARVKIGDATSPATWNRASCNQP